MQSLRVDGPVLVEAALDVTGHIEPGSARIFQSPNHAFDEEALRVVRGSVYRPARSESRAVREIGRASCREGVEIQRVAGSFGRNTNEELPRSAPQVQGSTSYG